MTRNSFQQGYVSKPIPTRAGIVFKIRYRMKSVEREVEPQVRDATWASRSEGCPCRFGRTNPRCIHRKARIVESHDKSFCGRVVETLFAAQRCEAFDAEEL